MLDYFHRTLFVHHFIDDRSSLVLGMHIRPKTYPGIEAGIAMAGILLLAAVGPFYQDYQRLKHPL